MGQGGPLGSLPALQQQGGGEAWPHCPSPGGLSPVLLLGKWRVRAAKPLAHSQRIRNNSIRNRAMIQTHNCLIPESKCFASTSLCL